MGQNQNSIQTSTHNTHNTNNTANNTETERIDDDKTYNNDQDTINEKQKGYQQQSFSTNQFKFDRPVTVSDVLEGKITLPTPVPKKPIEQIVNPQSNNNKENKDSKDSKDNKDNKDGKVLKEKKEIQRLSTTDSMQEYLEIPDNIPNDHIRQDEVEDENNEQSDDT